VTWDFLLTTWGSARTLHAKEATARVPKSPKEYITFNNCSRDTQE
jgi:hypothetical protein